MVRDYLGARIAMYFGFTAHLTSWMRVTAILSVACTFGMWVEVGVYGRARRHSRMRSIVNGSLAISLYHCRSRGE